MAAFPLDIDQISTTSFIIVVNELRYLLTFGVPSSQQSLRRYIDQLEGLISYFLSYDEQTAKVIHITEPSNQTNSSLP